MKIIAIIQARLSSTRLPGKVLKCLGEQPILKNVFDRVQSSSRVSLTLIATSSDPSDQPIEDFCISEGLPCYRGPLDDVLSRYYGAAIAHAADHVVRITADCPLIDPSLIDSVIDKHLEENADYTSNVEPRSYPDGLDVEVIKFSVLKKLHESVDDPSLREHVTVAVRLKKYDFKLSSLVCDQDYSDHRWTVDTPEDFEWVSKVDAALGDASYKMEKVLAWVQEHGKAHMQSDDTSKRFNDRLSGTGQNLYVKAKTLIPGGTQLLSKRPEMFLPDRWPAYYQSARGAWVKDLDGRGYLDMSTSGIGSCILGTADPVVNARVTEAVSRGSMSTLNAPEEVELADKLCELHPWADRVRFARSGGESMSMAVRIARAATNKDVVLICGYHGWSDWYLATNLSDGQGLDELLIPGLDPRGVPKGLTGTAIPFTFNNTSQFEALVQEYDGRVAAVVMEPQRFKAPDLSFLQTIRRSVDAQSGVLIFDEITSGWRRNIGGVHLLFGVEPDIAVFGKALSNGYAMGAVIGRDSVMEAAQNTFISSTYWTERIGPVASLATLERFKELNAPGILEKAGLAVQKIWTDEATSAGVKVVAGEREMAPLSHFSFDYDDPMMNRALKTLWCQEMLRAGVLDNGSFYATCAHHDEELEYYEQKVSAVFKVLAESIDGNTFYIDAGELSHQGFSRLTN